MTFSKSEKPAFYLKNRVDVTELMSLRPKLRRKFKVKITTNAFYLHAITHAVEKFPLMIGRLKGSTVTIPETVNIGFAINVPHGLVVPVIKHANHLTPAQTALAEKDLTEKARDNQLAPEELSEENIALSNLGAYGIDSFIAIIPPPATSILSVGNILREPVVSNGQMENRKVVYFTLSTDHRVVNGAYAARFLAKIKEILEAPAKFVGLE